MTSSNNWLNGRVIALGVDVGFSRQVASTGICVISPGHRRPVRCIHVTTDRTFEGISKLLEGEAPTSVSIDGPLVPGPTAGTYQIVSKYRTCEKLLSGGIFQRRCKPGPTNSPRGQALHFQATRVAVELTSRFPEAEIHEAFPNAFLGVMMPPGVFRQPIRRGVKSDVFWLEGVRKRILHNLVDTLYPSIARKLLPHWKQLDNHDERAAFVCALTARAAELKSALRIGGMDDGTINLPPRRFIQGWAVDRLSERIPGLN